MKKLMIMMILLVSIALFAKPAKLKTIKAQVWSDFTHEMMDIDVLLMQYPENDELTLLVEAPANSLEIKLSQEYWENLQDYLIRFNRKQHQAELREEILDVELGAFPVAECRFYKARTWHDAKINSTANFFSQKVDMHQFLIMTSPMHDLENERLKRDGLVLYFSSEETKSMRKIFTEKNWKRYQKIKS